MNQPGEPGGLRWDSAHVAAHVKICCINFGENQPQTRWEPGVLWLGPGLWCSPCQTMLVFQFGLWPGGNPEDRVRDPAYVVAHVKLYMCTNFGGIWPLNQWKTGGNPVGPGGPGQNLAYVVRTVKLCLCTKFGANRPGGSATIPDEMLKIWKRQNSSSSSSSSSSL